MAILDTTTTCLRTIICGLSEGAKASLRVLINTQIGTVQVALTAAEAQLVALVPEVAIGQAARDAINSVASATADIASLIPVSLMAGCLQLGDITKSIADAQAFIAANTNDINLILDDINKLLSLRDELNQLVTELNTILAGFNLILDTLSAC